MALFRVSDVAGGGADALHTAATGIDSRAYLRITECLNNRSSQGTHEVVGPIFISRRTRLIMRETIQVAAVQHLGRHREFASTTRPGTAHVDGLADSRIDSDEQLRVKRTYYRKTRFEGSRITNEFI